LVKAIATASPFFADDAINGRDNIDELAGAGWQDVRANSWCGHVLGTQSFASFLLWQSWNSLSSEVLI
jgi:hypothetical protein